MSSIKERILGAVTVMSEKDAVTLWKLIINTFSDWESIEEIQPDELDLAMLQEVENNPECKSFISNSDAMRELGLA